MSLHPSYRNYIEGCNRESKGNNNKFETSKIIWLQLTKLSN